VVVDRLETTSAIGGIALPALPVGYRIATFAAFDGLDNLFADGAEGQGFIRRFRGESAEITKAAGFPQHMVVQFVVVPHIGRGFLCRILGLDRWGSRCLAHGALKILVIAPHAALAEIMATRQQKGTITLW